MELDERGGGEGEWMLRRFLMSHRLIQSVLACGESLVMNDSFSTSIRGETLQIWSVILENTQVHAHPTESVNTKSFKNTDSMWVLGGDGIKKLI